MAGTTRIAAYRIRPVARPRSEARQPSMRGRHCRGSPHNPDGVAAMTGGGDTRSTHQHAVFGRRRVLCDIRMLNPIITVFQRVFRRHTVVARADHCAGLKM